MGDAVVAGFPSPEYSVVQIYIVAQQTANFVIAVKLAIPVARFFQHVAAGTGVVRIQFCTPQFASIYPSPPEFAG